MSRGAMAWPMKMLEAAFIDSTVLVPMVLFNTQPIFAVIH